MQSIKLYKTKNSLNIGDLSPLAICGYLGYIQRLVKNTVDTTFFTKSNLVKYIPRIQIRSASGNTWWVDTTDVVLDDIYNYWQEERHLKQQLRFTFDDKKHRYKFENIDGNQIDVNPRYIVLECTLPRCEPPELCYSLHKKSCDVFIALLNSIEAREYFMKVIVAKPYFPLRELFGYCMQVFFSVSFNSLCQVTYVQ